MTRPRAATGAAVCALIVCVVATACSGRAGTAVPDSSAVSAYVSAKFAGVFDELEERGLIGPDGIKSKLDSYISVGERKQDKTITAIQVGSPRARITLDRSNRDPGVVIDVFNPADDPLEYLRLGPSYAELAPTEWVAMPDGTAGFNECFWVGFIEVCKTIDAFTDAYNAERGSTATTARSLDDGSTELHAELSLETLLETRIIILPCDLAEQVTDDLRRQVVTAMLTLNPDGRISRIEMDGTLEGDGTTVVVRKSYDATLVPNEDELPAVPDASDVTELTTDEEIDDFYARKSEIEGGDGC